MLGLYIHIPFCNKICSYCDFYKLVASDNLKNEYKNALFAEMKLKNLSNYSFDTLYIGGGSPSSLSTLMLDEILKTLSNYVNLNKLKEFTIEVNPSDLNIELIKLFVKYHVNRVSIGVETFNKDIQKFINKEFDTKLLEENIKLLKENNIQNINIDLMYSFPNFKNPTKILEEDLKKAILLDVKHLSVYSLILEEHTIFDYLYKKGKLKLISEEEESSTYNMLINFLTKHDFEHYETSNFAKAGYQSLHNLIYWNCDEYIALGPSASSYFNNYRFTNINSIKDYIKGANCNNLVLSENSFIDESEAKNERIILNLRKTKGLNKNDFYNKFKIAVKDEFLNIDNLIKDGLLIESKNYIRIPKKYFYISNHIINKILK